MRAIITNINSSTADSAWCTFVTSGTVVWRSCWWWIGCCTSQRMASMRSVHLPVLTNLNVTLLWVLMVSLNVMWVQSFKIPDEVAIIRVVVVACNDGYSLILRWLVLEVPDKAPPLRQLLNRLRWLFVTMLSIQRRLRWTSLRWPTSNANRIRRMEKVGKEEKKVHDFSYIFNHYSLALMTKALGYLDKYESKTKTTVSAQKNVENCYWLAKLHNMQVHLANVFTRVTYE